MWLCAYACVKRNFFIYMYFIIYSNIRKICRHRVVTTAFVIAVFFVVVVAASGVDL